MGCGSSTLKGEKTEDVAAAAPQPIKKVRTNFSDVDFTGVQGKDSRRATLAVAPDEERRPTRISEAADETQPSSAQAKSSDGIVADTQQHHTDGQKLAPYRSIEGDQDLASPSKEPVPPVSASLASQSEATTTTAGLSPDSKSSEPRRKSWIDRIKDHGRDKSMDITDEELKKQTGMTRAEFEEFKKDPKNRVGSHQQAKDQGAFGGLAVSGSAMVG